MEKNHGRPGSIHAEKRSARFLSIGNALLVSNYSHVHECAVCFFFETRQLMG